MISLSQLACQGLNLAPLGDADLDPKKRIIRADHDKHCSYCGHPVAAGEVGFDQPLKTVGLFMNDFSLARPGEKWACRHCTPLLKSSAMRALMNSVVCGEGVFSVTRLEHRKYFLLNPPEPPWSMMISPSKLEHLIWRAAPTIDNSVIQVFHGGEQMMIRGERLPDILKSSKRLAHMITDMRRAAFPKRQQNPLKHPFVSLVNKRDTSTHGVLRSEAHSLPAEADTLILEMETLTHGERWALASLSNDDVEPIKPEPTQLK